MKKLKCDNCGASLKLDEKKEYANCPYCNTTYKLKEDLNVNINFDNNIQNTLLGETSKQMTNFSKFIFIFVLIFIFITFAIVIYSFLTFPHI